MSIIIQKYGGTSVGSVERMRHVADLIIAEQKLGHQVVVVASAMTGATNQLVKSVTQFENASNPAAYDFVISTGENVSCGMLALALAEKNVTAIPMAGWQVPILTNEIHSRARITSIDTVRLRQLLNQGIVPIVTGFQGLSPTYLITTLGRGGSDTSAVALAAALNASRCDIYTDIDGIYTADPRLVRNARFISHISYSIAFQMATLGTKIIHPRAVQCSMESNIPLRILSSFGSDKFTTLLENTPHSEIVGIAHMSSVVLIEVPLLHSSVSTQIIESLCDLDIPTDMIQISMNRLLVSVEYADVSQILAVLSDFNNIVISPQYAKISVVGTLSSLQAENVINSLYSSNIPIFHTFTDNLRTSVLVPSSQMDSAVNTLHAVFLNS